MSAQIETKQVSDLPVGNSRNFQALESLVPGVSAPIYDHSIIFQCQNSQSFQVNGQAELANNLQLEGIDDNERTGLLQVYIPPAAAIQTVDVETSNYAPEFGRAAGAVTERGAEVRAPTSFHGSAYEYNEVSATGARNYFNNTGSFHALPTTTTARPSAARSSRTGLFSSAIFCATPITRASSSRPRCLRRHFRSGDLSASPTAIYDPATGNADGTGRQQFAGNQISPARVQPGGGGDVEPGAAAECSPVRER